MKLLTASKIISGKKQELFDVNNLFDLPNRTDDNYMQYLATVMKDMDTRGMENPIIVVEKKNYWNRLPWQDDNKLGVVTGSNRFRYAQERGYDKIEGIMIYSRSEFLDLWNKTFYRVKSDLTNNK